MLSLACALMGASHVIGYDIDEDALGLANANKDDYEDDLPVC